MLLTKGDLGSGWESEPTSGGSSTSSGSGAGSCDDSMVSGPWHARAEAIFYQSASGVLSTATERLESSTSAVSEYEGAVRLMTRCGSDDPSQGELTRMAFPRVGTRSTAFQVTPTSRSSEDNPIPFRGALVVAVKGDVLLLFGNASSGTFDLEQFRRLVDQAATRIP